MGVINKMKVPCQVCDGSGEFTSITCKNCNGSGKFKTDRVYAIGKSKEGDVAFDVQRGQ